jgi:hypothetical protein
MNADDNVWALEALCERARGASGVGVVLDADESARHQVEGETVAVVSLFLSPLSCAEPTGELIADDVHTMVHLLDCDSPVGGRISARGEDCSKRIVSIDAKHGAKRGDAS